MRLTPPHRALSPGEFLALFALITALTALSIDALLPALGFIGDDLQLEDARNEQLIISLFIFGMLIGELVFGPLSDAMGRKPVILLGLLVFGVGCVVALFADSLTALLLGRILQGLGASGPKIASRALIRDCYEGEAMARIMSLIFMLFILVPMIAPALGQLIVELAHWRGIFVLFLIWAMVAAVWLSLRQPETLKPEHRIPFYWRGFVLNVRLILGHRRTLALIVAAGCVFGAQLLFLSTAEAIFSDIYQVGSHFPAYFAALALAIGLASFVNSRLVQQVGIFAMAHAGVGCLTVAGAGLLLLAWWQSGQPPLIAFMLLTFLAFIGIGFLLGNLFALGMQALGQLAGTGASVFASLSSLIAVCCAVTLGRFYDATVFPLATGYLLGGLAVAWLLRLAARSSTAPVPASRVAPV